MANRESLVARGKTGCPAKPALTATTAAEDVSAPKSTNKDQHIRLGNTETFAAHLSLHQFKMPPSDRMAIGNCPEPLLLTSLTPMQVAKSPHQACKDLGKNARVQP